MGNGAFVKYHYLNISDVEIKFLFHQFGSFSICQLNCMDHCETYVPKIFSAEANSEG